MKMRPQPSLRRVLDDLGATLLELVCGDAAAVDEIGGVAIHDPVDEPGRPGGRSSSASASGRPQEAAELLAILGKHEAAGLVLRSPAPLSDEVTAAVEASGVPLLGLTRGASWTQLAALLRPLLSEGDIGDDGQDTLGGLPSGDLFSVANAVAALIDAPVTIEDRSSRVLAFSGRQDEADQSRVETILGRQVPERYSQLLTELGVFRELYRSEDPVYVVPEPDGRLPEFTLPRAAVAVRAGDEVLGSIWAAVRDPLTPDRARAMRDAARLVALHLLRDQGRSGRVTAAARGPGLDRARGRERRLRGDAPAEARRPAGRRGRAGRRRPSGALAPGRRARDAPVGLPSPVRRGPRRGRGLRADPGHRHAGRGRRRRGARGADRGGLPRPGGRPVKVGHRSRAGGVRPGGPAGRAGVRRPGAAGAAVAVVRRLA